MKLFYCIAMSLMVLTGVLTPVLLAAESANSAPVIEPIARQYILEGDRLQLKITATDADHDALTLGIISRPLGSIFLDKGNGTADFSWTPDFTGPNSSEGSPFELTFWAGDGHSSSLIRTEVIVTNKNRRPIISAPDTVRSVAGDLVSCDLSADDPDHDRVDWSLLNLPDRVSFSGGNPGHISWSSSYRDSGYYPVRIAAVDQYGAADTAQIVLKMAQAVIYALTVDTSSGYPGEIATVNIKLANLEPISGFDLVTNYDASALSLISISTAETRAANFEYFNYKLNDRGIQGDVRTTGIADMLNGTVTPDLAAGSGPIVKLNFYITSDLNFAGYSIPLRFVFRDILTGIDNTLTDTSGNRIQQSAIDYFDGYVRIMKSAVGNLGDINLNGMPYEIGDMVYFTNYFINPWQYPLDPVQRANSDVNRDGTPATVADLVFLLKRLVNGSSPTAKPRYNLSPVDIYARDNAGGFELSYDAIESLGALALTLEGDREIPADLNLVAGPESSGMQCKWRTEGNLLRVLLYSESGRTMPAGVDEFLKIENISAFTIKEIQASTADGYTVPVAIKGDPTALPTGYTLYQNFPNPFNPATEIRFDLPAPTPVKLTVYNLLGAEVAVLIDGELPGGHHTVVWDGKDHSGNTVASGIYFYRLKAADYAAQKKMILIK
jgi:Cohesin domain/FlgD Ig-like domain/Putative Ig domain